MIRYTNALLEKGKQKLLEYKNVSKNDESIKVVFNHLNRIVKFGVILAIVNFFTFPINFKRSNLIIWKIDFETIFDY